MAIVLWAGEGADCVDNAFRRIDDAFGAEQVVRLRGGQVVLELDNFGFEANGVWRTPASQHGRGSQNACLLARRAGWLADWVTGRLAGWPGGRPGLPHSDRRP